MKWLVLVGLTGKSREVSGDKTDHEGAFEAEEFKLYP